LDFLARLDAMAQAEIVARGELRAVDLLDACEQRIERINPLIHAAVSTDFAAARARVERGVSGPLAGVPFLFKDLVAYPGQRWSLGSRLFAHNVAQQGSAFTEKVDAAGLVTVGKSATSEFGLVGSTETLLEGVTHNPWDLSLSATGSSGGAAAAVASGIVPLAHASDGGGSIRIPASAAGLFGLKPSRGRHVPASAVESEFGALVSEGCISRSVRDSALFLSLVEGDGSRGWPALGFVREPTRRKLRIGAWTTTLLGTEPDSEVRQAWEATLGLCTELGHEVVLAAPPALDGAALSLAFFTVAGSSLAGMVDLLETTLGRQVRADELEPFTRALIQAARAQGRDGLTRAAAAFQAAIRTYVDATASFDVVLTPTLATRPWRLGAFAPTLAHEELIRRTERSVCYTPIQNIVGCPAMSVPLYWTADGVPIGSHFAAPLGREDVLLGLAYELEAARPWAPRWAPQSIVELSRD
jgi:amidase